MEIEDKMWRRVNRYVRFLQVVPFVRMVAVCNNLAFGKVDKNSDIDLFVVAKSGRLFVVRTFVTFVLQILGVRRHGKKIAGRFCLSFFVDDSSLDLKNISIPQDIYLAFWVRSMLPVIDDSVSREFLAANLWAQDYFEDQEKFVIDRSRLIESGRLNGWVRDLMEFLLQKRFGDFLEKRLRKWQLRRAGRKAVNVDSSASLVVSEHMLKFHNMDRRRLYRREWFRQFGKDAKLNSERFTRLLI